MTEQLDSVNTDEAYLSDVGVAEAAWPQTARGKIALWSALGVAPLLLYVLLRPDWYFVEGGLDPYFYTGYTQNFDDVLRVLGNGHYSVTRWSLYLPQHYLSEIYGPWGGYMLFRALIVGAIVACLYSLAKRWWSVPTLWLTLAVALCSPLLLRPIFSDYSETVYVPAGIAVITLLALWPGSPSAAAMAGAVAALAVASHPVGATIVLAAFAAWLGIPQGWRVRAVFVSVFVCVCGTVLLGAAVWFRVRYDVNGIYTPTIDFFRERSGVPDPLRSPRLLWLGYYLWIYLPAFVLGVGLWLRRSRGWIPNHAQRMILTTCALQYAFQIWYEFARKGITLEIIYYWNYMVPSLLLATVVVVGQLATVVAGRRVMALAFGIPATLLVAPSPFPSARSWLDVAVVVGVACYLAYRFADRYPIIPLAVVSSMGIVVPLIAPNPLPLAPGEQTIRADYSALFKSTDSPGQQAFEAQRWFIEQANTFGDDVERNMYFWIGGGHGHQFAAAYVAHASGRWLNAGWFRTVEDALTVDESTWGLIESCQIPYIAMVGTSADVDTMVAELRMRGVRTTRIFDAVAPTDEVTRADIVRVGPCPSID